MHRTVLTRLWIATASSVSAAACLLVFLLSPALADPVQNRRILDIESKNLGDKWRIVIYMDTATRPIVTPPGNGEPLRIELGRSDLDPSVRVDRLTGPLLRKASLALSDSGLVTIALDLTTSQVDVTDFLDEQSGLVIVDIKPRRASALPDATPSPAPVPTAVASAEPPAPTATSTSTATAAVALPPVPAAPQSEPSTATPVLPATAEAPVLALPPVAGATPEIAQVPDARPATRSGPVDELTVTDAFPNRLLTLDFRRAPQMLAAYQSGKYLEALKIGMAALSEPQPPASLESLLYLLAECRFQQTHVYDASPGLKRPEGWDWPEVQNHFEQARRFAPASPLRPFADFRLSQVYGMMGDTEGCQAMLAEILRRGELPNLPDVLLDYGDVLLITHSELPHTTTTLVSALHAFRAFAKNFPNDNRLQDALFNLGEVYYQLGNDREAYNNFREGALSLSPVLNEKHAHWGLAAHRIGMTDLTLPSRPVEEVASSARQLAADPKLQSQQGRELLAAFVRDSKEPAVHLELAQILDKAGKRREAMREYERIVRGIDKPATEGQILQARRALANYALEDRLAGTFDPKIPYDDYAEADKCLADLYENCFDLRMHTLLLRDLADNLKAQGRTNEAVALLLPHLEPGRLPEADTDTLRQSLWEPLPGIIDSLYRGGDDMQALRLYRLFGKSLASHPRRDDILIDCARILLKNEMRVPARRALDAMSPYETLSPEHKVIQTLLRREAQLDPSDPESFKRDAEALLRDAIDDPTRARLLRHLVRLYRDGEQYAYAAQLDRQGAALKGLGLAERVAFYLDAARQYEAGMVYSKAIETYYQAIYAVEEAGVAPADAHDWYGPALMGMAQNFQRLGDYEQASRACIQYLKYYPDGSHVAPMRYALGQCYEQLATEGAPTVSARALRTKALEQYDALAENNSASASNTFWRNVGRQSADQLRWEQDHPYLVKGSDRP